MNMLHYKFGSSFQIILIQEHFLKYSLKVTMAVYFCENELKCMFTHIPPFFLFTVATFLVVLIIKQNFIIQIYLGLLF